MPEVISEISYLCKGRRVVTEGVVARVVCGHDITKLILSLPQDGEPRVVACPKCETKTKVLRTPPDEP